MFGEKIVSGKEFNLSFVKYNTQWIAAFQTKVDWRKESPLHLVKDSVDTLTTVATEHPKWTYHLPFPAISHGGQSVDEGLPLLHNLPDNVLVYLDK